MPYELMARRCDQCLMGPNKIVSDWRRQEILQITAKRDTGFICHKGTMIGRDIACRGHYDATGGGQLARIAGRLNAIVEVDLETLNLAESWKP